MSKLQKKSVRLVLFVYLLILVVGGGLSYFMFFKPLKENAITAIRQKHEYSIQEMDALVRTIKEYAIYIGYSNELYDALEAWLAAPEDEVLAYEVSSILNHQANVKRGIRGAVIQCKDMPYLVSLLRPHEEELALLDTEWYQSFKEQDYGNRFSAGITTYNNDPQDGQVSAVAYVCNFNVRQIKFTLTLYLDFYEIFGSVQRYRQKEFSAAYWLDSAGAPLFNRDTLFEEFMTLKEASETTSSWYEGQNGMYFTGYLIEGGYTSVVYESTEQIQLQYISFLKTIITVFIIFILASLLIVLKIIQQITRPVAALSKAMNYAVEKDLKSRISVTGDDEISDLGRNYNQMMDDINRYVTELVEKEEKEQEMKFGLLISQIDPHFVCNTLNTVNYLAKMRRYEDVMVVATALSNLLRDRLRIKEFQIYDTVWQEIDTVRQYMKIQQYRYGDGVHICYMVDEAVSDEWMPKNIIQPLVENALLHGLANEVDGSISGELLISVRKNSKGLILQVKDNGRGMSEEKMREVLDSCSVSNEKNRSSGIGIAGIRARLEILYKGDYQLKIESSPGKGTDIWIQLNTETLKENKHED